MSASLPTTSDIKPVAVWLIFNLAYPFIIILVNVILQVNLLKGRVQKFLLNRLVDFFIKWVGGVPLVH